MDATQRRNAVRDRYARAATTGDGCCGPVDSCAPSNGATATATAVAEEISCAVGYDESELKSVPDGANLGLGCGNPVALASLSPGETVLDLGSGAGFANVEFRLGEIEALPVAGATVDAVISNCVLNLSGDRPRVLAEVMRVLKPGGRVMVSDLVSDQAVPDFVAESKDSLAGCLPVLVSEYRADLARAGFTEVSVESRQRYPSEHILADPRVQAVIRRDPLCEAPVRDFVESIHGGTIRAVKPID